MRILALLAMSACAFAQAPGGSVEGTVTNAITGQPLGNAHVSVKTGNRRFGVVTGPDGHFSIEPLAPGAYDLLAERNGFVAPEPKKIALGEGDHKRDLELKMLPAGSISGHVLKGNGEPAHGYQVNAIRGENAGGWSTDDDGNFRIGGLRPGKYLVRASPPSPSSPPEIRTDGTTEVYYGPTYFPGALDAASAVAVEVKAGSEASGIEIRLLPQPVLSISGQVSGAPDGADNTFVSAPALGGTRVHKDGTFVFWKVPAGSYLLSATSYAHNGAYQSAPVKVDLIGSSMTGVELRVVPPFELNGRVEGWGNGPGKLRLIDLGGLQSGPMEASIDSSGAFRFPGAIAGLYRVVVEGLPESSYVKRVVRGTTEMADRILELRGPGEAVSIEAATGAARISGVASDTNGPVSSALVALFPEGPHANDLRVIVTTGVDGKYSFPGLAPGRYSLLALPALEPSALARYDEKLDQVSLAEGETQTKDLSVRKQ